MLPELKNRVSKFLPPQYNPIMRSLSKDFASAIAPLSRKNKTMDFSLNSDVFVNKYYATLFEIKPNTLSDETVFEDVRKEIKILLERKWLYLREDTICQELRKTYALFNENVTDLPRIIANVEQLTFRVYNELIKLVIQITLIPEKYDYIYYLAALYQQRIDIFVRIYNTEYRFPNYSLRIKQLGYVYIEVVKICILHIEHIKPEYMYRLLVRFYKSWMIIHSKGIHEFTEGNSNGNALCVCILYMIYYLSPPNNLIDDYDKLKDFYHKNKESVPKLSLDTRSKVADYTICMAFLKGHFKTILTNPQDTIILIE